MVSVLEPKVPKKVLTVLYVRQLGMLYEVDHKAGTFSRQT